MGFVKNTKYYRDTVYEWNIPTGSTCPYAKDCKVTVDRTTGKFKNESKEYYCYASKPERFPGVREHRWKNFEESKKGNIVIPKDCQRVRIHASGDFYSQAYFDLWLDIARKNPNIEFWAYTKSLRFWVKRKDEIPSNLVLTASYGGYDDNLIKEHNFKNVIVYKSKEDVPKERPIDTNDDYARMKDINFALVDNQKKGK